MEIKNKKQQGANKSTQSLGPFKRFFRNFGIKKEVYSFVENLSTLLSTGMDISSAMGSIREETKKGRMQTILSRMEEAVAGGSPLNKAMEKAQVFSPRVLALIRVGEQSGKLTENLEVVVLQNEKETLFKSKVRSSLMYAVIVFTLTIVVGVGTAWFTLPKVASFFNELDAELPAITRGLIFVGEFLSQYGIFIIPIFALGVLSIFYFLFSFPKTKFIGHAALFRIPLVRNLIKQVEISRFGYLLGTMFDSGMSVVDAVESLEGATTFKNYQKFYVYLKGKIEEGNSLQKSFNEYPRIQKLFPSSVRQMISAAEKSGKLSAILLRIGKSYEQKTEATARNLPIILEPIMLIIIGLGVALIALGIIMPIYNLSSII
ncbi:type II secretion system F family protein [Candidatus Falkowbacteria bacterium]|nr:type II secretion system F family protein [Candidatus Falkowbacteria bacterium]